MASSTCTLRIEGVYYESQTIEGVAITYGKQDPTDNFRPAYATATLISDASGLDVNILDDVRIFMTDSVGTVQVFAGKVTDYTVNLLSDDFAETSLTIVSPLAKLSRREVGSTGFASEFDGVRIQNILEEAMSSTWEETGGTWLDQEGTWQDFENFVGTIDSGDYLLDNYSGGIANALDLISLAETSGLGHVYESTDGQMNYQAAGARMTAAAAGFTDLEADEVIVTGISSEQTTGNLRNETIALTHTGSSATAQDIHSIRTYGRTTNTVQTQLKHVADALLWAERDVALYAWPRSYISGFTTRLSALDTATADQLINIEGGLPIRILNLPPVIASNPYAGFIEGWQWRIDRADAEIKIFVSDYALSVVSQEWKNVQTSFLWNTISTALTWENLEVII